MIDVINRQRRVRVPSGNVVAVAEGTLEAIGRSGSSVAVAFVSGRSISRLNRLYRHKAGQTDVLSFSASEGNGVPGARGYLGDIAISIDAAMTQAARAGHSLKREISELVIHGVLHLCGYDHESDQGEMNRLELKLRRRILGTD